MIRVLVVDDEPLVRSGVRMILEGEDDIEVVGEAPDGTKALEQTNTLAPDVVILDIRMPEMDGIETTRRLLQHPNAPRILILTTFDLDEYVYDAMKAGASGFILKNVPPAKLVDAVRTVAGGEALLLRDHPPDDRTLRPTSPNRSRPAGTTHRTDRARARGAAPDRPRPLKRRNRHFPLSQRSDRQVTCQPPALKA